MKKDFRKINKQSGAAMLISIVFFLFISLAIISGLVSPSIREFKNANVNLNSKKSFFLAESGIEDSFYRIIKNKPIGTSETITLDSNTTTTTITTLGGGEKEITSLADVSSFQRQLGITLSTSVGVSFNYGVQVGQGGVDLTGSAGVNGNVYANGPITGSSSSFITGTAISANSPALAADQTNGTGVPAYNVSFANASSTQDIAQSFQVSVESPLNKIQIYIKKISTPSNATVKIVNNNNGNPGTTTFATGTLSASTVTTSYGWIDVTFSSNPLLDVGTTYWLVVDAGTSSTKYYIIGASNGGYANGLGKIGQMGGTWNNTTPSGLDYYFNIYLGGVTGLIAGSSGSQWNQLHIGTVSGTAQAHTVNYTNATGNIYCQIGTGNNKSCTPQTDPTYIAFPISEANITQWKTDAEAGGIYNGNYSVGGSNTVSLGPKYITGNLNVDGSGTLNVTGTLYVGGNLTLGGSGKIRLDSSYGTNDGVIVVTGIIDNGGSGQFLGSGTSGSYILALTTNNCDSSFCSSDAIEVSGSAGSVILYAPNGTIEFGGSAAAKEATAYKIKLSGSSTITYESGLTNNNFSSGPSGSWVVSNWGEK